MLEGQHAQIGYFCLPQTETEGRGPGVSCSPSPWTLHWMPFHRRVPFVHLSHFPHPAPQLAHLNAMPYVPSWIFTEILPCLLPCCTATGEILHPQSLTRSRCPRDSAQPASLHPPAQTHRSVQEALLTCSPMTGSLFVKDRHEEQKALWEPGVKRDSV